MKSLTANWKTTSAGIAAVLSGGGHLIAAVSNGDFSTIAADVPAILAGLGLIFAKDGNVTGGNVRQPS